MTFSFTLVNTLDSVSK